MSTNVVMQDGEEQVPLLSKQGIRERIESLPISADAKAILFDIAEITIDVGGKLVQAGRKILSFVFDLVQRFPNTTFGVLVGFVLTALVSSVPLLGPVLGALLGPLLIALGIGMGALADMKGDRAFAGRVQRLEEEFVALTSTPA